MMDEYKNHMAMIADMNGWEPAATAPRSQVVTAMDHAGNVCRAVLTDGGWHTHSESALLDAKPFNVRKWKPKRCSLNYGTV